MSLQDATSSLKRGEFVLLYDSGNRENEVDMVVAAEFVTPEHISRMRQSAGGLICIAIKDSFAKSLNLQYMHNILLRSTDVDAESKQMIMGTAPYGDHPTAKLYHSANPKQNFVSSFTTPGHVPLLLASNGLLASRQGHTEMSVYLAELAKLTPVTAICEMMDSQTYSALTIEKAQKFAKENAIPFVDGKELLEFSKVH
jgi:3,4-dihydroxy 2-butanone 4-phosphate synthase